MAAGSASWETGSCISSALLLDILSPGLILNSFRLLRIKESPLRCFTATTGYKSIAEREKGVDKSVSCGTE
jgi:hypothetical protein